MLPSTLQIGHSPFQIADGTQDFAQFARNLMVFRILAKGFQQEISCSDEAAFVVTALGAVEEVFG